MRRLWFSGLSTLIVAITGCDSTSEPNTVLLRFEGTVHASGNQPIAGATVSLMRQSFVFSSVVAQDTTDISGRFTLEHAALCSPGVLNKAAGNSWYLNARNIGYSDLSSINLNYELTCTTTLQRVDFVLERAS